MEIKTFIESIKFRQSVNRSGIGTIGNYYVSFFPGSFGFSVVPYFTFNLSEPPSDKVLSTLRIVLSKYKVTVDKEHNTLFIIFHKPIGSMKTESIESIQEILERTVTVLSELRLSQPNSCFACDQTGYDTFFFEHGVHRPIHQNCLNQRLENHKPPSDLNEVIDPLSYMKSMLFAVVLALMLTLPSVLAVIYAPILYTIALFLIPFGFSIGYRLGHGVVVKQTYMMMRLTAYLTGIIIIIWCWYFYSKTESTNFFAYVTNLDNLIPFFFDIIVGSLMITIGLLLAKKMLPVRKF